MKRILKFLFFAPILSLAMTLLVTLGDTNGKIHAAKALVEHGRPHIDHGNIRGDFIRDKTLKPEEDIRLTKNAETKIKQTYQSSR